MEFERSNRFNAVMNSVDLQNHFPVRCIAYRCTWKEGMQEKVPSIQTGEERWNLGKFGLEMCQERMSRPVK